jgi:hypothetical protein
MYNITLFTIYHLPFTIRLQLSVYSERIAENVWKIENCKLIIATPQGGAYV